MPDARDVFQRWTRRGFLEAMAAAAVAVTQSPTRPPTRHLTQNLGSGPGHPVFTGQSELFNLWQAATFQKEGRYEMLKGKLEKDFLISSAAIFPEPSAHLKTLLQFFGDGRDLPNYAPNCVIEMSLDARSFFEGPAYYVLAGLGISPMPVRKMRGNRAGHIAQRAYEPWGGMLLHSPILIPAGVSIEFTAELRFPLDEPLKVYTSFQGTVAQ